MKSWKELLERIIFKLTSGQFILTVVVSVVFAHLAINGMLQEDRIMEVTLIVLYAYFTKNRNGNNGNGEDENGKK